MGNLASTAAGGGGNNPSAGASPHSMNLMDAIVRASKEANKRTAALHQPHHQTTTFESDDDEEEEYDEDDMKKGNRASGVLADATRPWLTSTKEELETEQHRMDQIKESCCTHYPGKLSSYVDKLKWAEQKSRLHHSDNDDIGAILREIVLENAPEDILVQILIRRRSLKCFDQSEEAAREFFSLCSGNETEKQQVVSDVPQFSLRPDFSSKFKDDDSSSNSCQKKFSNYVQWIFEEEEPGTILSSKQQQQQTPQPQTTSTTATATDSGTTTINGSQLTCLMNIQTKKDITLSNIIDPLYAKLKCKPGCQIEYIGPSVLPPRFITTLLNYDYNNNSRQDMIGSLPHYPSSIHGDNAVCAALELIISDTSAQSDFRTANFCTNSHSLLAMSPQRNDLSRDIVNKSWKDQEHRLKIIKRFKNPHKTFIMLDLPMIMNKTRQQQQQQLAHNLQPEEEEGKTTNEDINVSSSSLQQQQQQQSIPVIWLSSHFDKAFPRIKSHCLNGKGEAIEIRNRLRLTTTSHETIADRFHCQFELFESNLNNVIENRIQTSTAERFCELLALTLVVAFGDHQYPLRHLTNDASLVEHLIEDNDDIMEFFEDLGTFWKSMLKKSDVDLGLGLDGDEDGDSKNGSSTSTAMKESSSSREAFLVLLNFLEELIEQNYRCLLDDEMQVDLGGSSCNPLDSSVGQQKKKRKRDGDEGEEN